MMLRLNEGQEHPTEEATVPYSHFCEPPPTVCSTHTGGCLLREAGSGAAGPSPGRGVHTGVYGGYVRVCVRGGGV